MSEIAVIVGAAGMLVVGFVACDALRRRPVATFFRRVPVGTAGAVPVARQRADLPGNPR